MRLNGLIWKEAKKWVVNDWVYFTFDPQSFLSDGGQKF